MAPALEARIQAALRDADTGQLKPIREKLGEDVSYDEIRLVVAKWRGVGRRDMIEA